MWQPWAYTWQQPSWQDQIAAFCDRGTLSSITIVPACSQSFVYLSTWPCFSLLSPRNSIIVSNFTLDGEFRHGNQASQNTPKANRTNVSLPLR